MLKSPSITTADWPLFEALCGRLWAGAELAALSVVRASCSAGGAQPGGIVARAARATEARNEGRGFMAVELMGVDMEPLEEWAARRAVLLAGFHPV